MCAVVNPRPKGGAWNELWPLASELPRQDPAAPGFDLRVVWCRLLHVPTCPRNPQTRTTASHQRESCLEIKGELGLQGGHEAVMNSSNQEFVDIPMSSNNCADVAFGSSTVAPRAATSGIARGPCSTSSGQPKSALGPSSNSPRLVSRALFKSYVALTHRHTTLARM